MICEVLAVGTELLLGPVVDTNSTWIGERLAENGIDSYRHVVVGDNHTRIVAALREALDRSDVVLVTGGLGPTQDDITRNAMAEVMGEELIFDEAMAAKIEAMFMARGRTMTENNKLQAWRPTSASVLSRQPGTAPGLQCPVGDKLVFLMPGVPYEMREMMEHSVLPVLRERSGVAAVINSRTLRTWGAGESNIAELVGPRLDALADAGNPTIAFLAKGIEGIHVRITAKAENEERANALLLSEEAQLRAILGDLVFGVDDVTMERAVGEQLLEGQQTLAVAESLTGGLIASRLTETPGSSAWFRGGVVSYASEVKFDVLGVPEGPVVSAEAAVAMAAGVRALLKADIGLGITGVAGPTEQEGQPVGTVFGGLALADGTTEVVELHLPQTGRQAIRELAAINLLDALRKHLR